MLVVGGVDVAGGSVGCDVVGGFNVSGCEITGVFVDLLVAEDVLILDFSSAGFEFSGVRFSVGVISSVGSPGVLLSVFSGSTVEFSVSPAEKEDDGAGDPLISDSSIVCVQPTNKAIITAKTIKMLVVFILNPAFLSFIIAGNRNTSILRMITSISFSAG